jgi:hypothetical protein
MTSEKDPAVAVVALMDLLDLLGIKSACADYCRANCAEHYVDNFVNGRRERHNDCSNGW